MLQRGGQLLRCARALLRPERGTALVEFAVIVPVLVLILLGILDFGRAVNDWNDETHVANLVARYVAVGTLPNYGKCGTNNYPSETPAQFAACEVGIDSPPVQNGSNGGNGPSPAGVCISFPPGSTGIQGAVEVQISTAYKWFPLFKFPFTTSTIAGSATQELDDQPPSTWATQATPCY